jgi:cytochrome P450
VALADIEMFVSSSLELVLGLANHEENRWATAEVFDLARSRQTHVGFGLNAQTCLGHHPAKMEAEALMRTLFRELPSFVLDGNA